MTKTTPLDLSPDEMRLIESYAKRIWVTNDHAATALVHSAIERRYVQPRRNQQSAQVMQLHRQAADDSVTHTGFAAA